MLATLLWRASADLRRAVEADPASATMLAVREEVLVLCALLEDLIVRLDQAQVDAGPDALAPPDPAAAP
jgi:hypothetical protein